MAKTAELYGNKIIAFLVSIRAGGYSVSISQDTTL